MADALVGRAAESAVLREALGCRLRRPVVAVVCGDPGIGKTRLLGELAADAQRRGCVVLAGRAAEFEREVPLGVIRNALADQVGALPAATLAALGDTDLQLLRAVFPALAAPGGADPPVLAAERYRVHRAVRALLEAMADPCGLVLILDDLHWSDEGSLELLDHLLRHPPRRGVLIAVAYRPRQVSARLGQAVQAAVQRELATVVTLGPLSFAEAGELLPADVGAARRQELYEASGGNPFHLELLARATDSAQAPAVDRDAALPSSVRAALAGEFAALDARHRRILHAAAVAGDDVDPGLLAAVAELTPGTVLEALDDLAARDLVRPGGFAGGFRFRHPLLRNAAYHDAGVGWRLGAHARAAVELRRRGAPLAEQAVHVEASGPVGDMAAVTLLHRAAMDAIRVTPATAAHWLRSALRLLPRDPSAVATRLELLSLRAEALGITGRLAESRQLLGEILELLPAGTEQRVRVVTFLTMLHHLLGNHGQARALARRELDHLPDPSGMAAGELRVALALTGLMPGPVEGRAVESAIGVARGTGHRPLLAAALGIGVVASQAFEVAQDRTPGWLDEVTELVDAMPDRELAERPDTALFLSWGELYLERFPSALRHVDRALQVARSSGQSHLIGSLLTVEGVVHCATGNLPAALAVLDDAMEAVMLTGGRDARPRVLDYQCWARVWTGELDEALALGREAVASAAGGNVLEWQSASAEGMLGFALYAAGDPDGCQEALLRAGGGPDLPAVRPIWRLRWFEVLAGAAAAAGNHRRAAEVAARVAAAPAPPWLGRRTATVELIQVHATLHRDPATAARHATRAARLFGRSGDRLGEARAHLFAGAAYRALGDAGADRELSAAHRKFAQCGARPHWLARLAGVSMDAEQPPAPADPARVHRLTRRELDVLALLSESLTAAAIARRLGISVGTVHKHLAALYRKLGTADRLATVLRARALGLVTDAAGGPWGRHG